MEKIHENTCKQAFSNKKTTSNTCSHVFSPISAHFYPPLHHNGKESIVTIFKGVDIVDFRNSMW